MERTMQDITASEAVRVLIEQIGEDPDREGLRETPDRVVRSFQEIYGGYGYGPKDIARILKTFEDGACDEIVLLKNVEFYSVCEHHMQPFFGNAHIAYIPNGKVVGVSKLARLLNVFSRRLQIQERLTTQITEALMEHLQPKGAACILTAKHFCMVCRGVNKQNAEMRTSSLRGAFMDEIETRAELFSLISLP